jgi:regulator of protease activity HflC (stomatin/prohibitin superfamily)
MNWAEIFKEILRFFPRFEIIPPDEGGLFVRCGKFKKVVSSGVYFCLPYFDEITRFTTSIYTTDKFSQSLTTKDKRDIIISWTCTFLVADGARAFLDIDDVDEQILASVAARVTEYAGKKDYADMKTYLISNYIMREEFIKHTTEMWGINITGFYLQDLALHKTLRLIHGKVPE